MKFIQLRWNNDLYRDEADGGHCFTQAEEDFLREGVVKYDGDATKWRKILDDPDYHFHESRNTVDLKDKWRNILKKDGAEEAD